jgi:hypothetical protein
MRRSKFSDEQMVQIRIFMERDGFAMSIDRAHRLWKKAQLQVPHKRSRRRIATGRPGPTGTAYSLRFAA